MSSLRGSAIALFGFLLAGGSAAQPSADAAPAAPSATQTTEAALVTGPLVSVRLGETIGSDTHERGAKFLLEVTEPVLIDGVTAIPAGSRAEGEVVHAAKSGPFGKAAELTLTSRAVFVGDRRIPLHGLLLADVAESRNTAAGAARVTARVLSDLTIVRTTASGAYGLFAAFIKGDRIVVPEGTELVAHVANAEALGGSPIAAESAAPSAAPGAASVVFYRPRRTGGLGLPFTVREGTVELGTLKMGEFLVVAAAPGVHEYTVKSEVRDVLTLEVEPSGTYYVQGSFNQGFVVARPNLSLSNGEAFEALREGLEEAVTAAPATTRP